MTLSGVTWQWRSRDGLFAALAERQAALRLLEILESVDGPDLWVETTDRKLHFHATDVAHGPVDAVPLAYVHFDTDGYRVEYPCPAEFRLWSDAMIVTEVMEVERAAKRLLVAARHSGNNPSRPGADSKWYVCPFCDFHLPSYSGKCKRCGESFPSEAECERRGIFRAPHTPEWAVAPTKSGIPWMT